MPKLRAIGLLHFKVITLTLLHCLAKIRTNYEIITLSFIKKKLVGLTGFEPATSSTQSSNHTKLDHNPNESAQSSPQFKLDNDYFK